MLAWNEIYSNISKANDVFRTGLTLSDTDFRQFVQYANLTGIDMAIYKNSAMNASWGTSTRPTIFMRFLPSFCFSRSFRLRVMSPP